MDMCGYWGSTEDSGEESVSVIGPLDFNFWKRVSDDREANGIEIIFITFISLVQGECHAVPQEMLDLVRRQRHD